jgi:hypothetical protein
VARCQAGGNVYCRFTPVQRRCSVDKHVHASGCLS